MISEALMAACDSEARRAWLAALPGAVAEAVRRWSLTLGTPFADATRAWVAPAFRANGTRAVLKLGMPHFEGAHEIAGLRFWAGEPFARLLDADEASGAMLLERCEPGTSLREVPEPEQDAVIASLLRRLWREPPAATSVAPLSKMLDYWSECTRKDEALWPDPGLVREGLALFASLPPTAAEHVMLATDLHAGNVLRAEREPWLAIDPKPFVGDPAYDATQHLLNCLGRVRENPRGTTQRFADLLELEANRVRLWLFARVASEPRERWKPDALAKMLAP